MRCASRCSRKPRSIWARAEVARVSDAPKALAVGMKQQRRLAKSLSRKQKGSHHRKDAAARLGRHHHRVANVRRHFLHQVSGELVKTHDRIVIENLNVRGMLSNHRLARAISDAGWSEFARLLKYKQAWRGGQMIEADRWYPSTCRCPECGVVDSAMTLADRVFTCGCGHSADRDTNAAVNLARWGHDVIALKGGSYRIKHTAIESLPSVEADRQANSNS